MKAPLFVIACMFLAAASRADRLVVDMDMYVGNRTSTTYEVRSVGGVEYYDASGNIDFNQDLNVGHYITNETTQEEHSGPLPNAGIPRGQYIATLEVGAAPRQCFSSFLSASANNLHDRKDAFFCTLDSCCPQAQPEPQPAPQPCTSNDPTLCSGGSGGGGGGGSQTKWTDECYYNVWYGSVCNSPLVVNLGFGTYRFSGTNAPVSFDLDADGSPDSVAWTDALSDVAFVVLDRNGNGLIDSGAELFGNHSPKSDGTTAHNGFDALGDFDSDGDGKIDVADSVWPRLRLWVDRNHDGNTAPNEILLPSAVGVTRFGLNYHWNGRRDQNGNMLRYKGLFTIYGTEQPYYDVYLRMLQ